MPPKRKASKAASAGSAAQKKAKTEPSKTVPSKTAPKATKPAKPTKATPQVKATKASTASSTKVVSKKVGKVEPVIEIEDTPSPPPSPIPLLKTKAALASPSAVALSVNFTGKYDLYPPSGLSYEHDDFLPDEVTEKPDFANIHKTLLRKQKEREWAARVAIRGSIDPDDEEFADWSDMGRFLCREMQNRAGGVLKPICIMDGETKSDGIEFDKEIAIHPSMVGEGPAYISDLTLGPIGRKIECGMNWKHGGSLMMRKVWQGEKDSEELFEVWFTFVIDFGVYFYQRGRGTKDEYTCTYWAIRAAKNSRGEDIGISAEGDGKDTDEDEEDEDEDEDEDDW